MLNILRTFQLGFHRFFSLYLCSAWNRRDRDASTAPTAQNTPDTRESCSRAKALQHGTRQAAEPGGHYHKSPNDGTLQLCTLKRELEQFFHPPLLAANYINANISGVLYASISCHCLSSEMKTAIYIWDMNSKWNNCHESCMIFFIFYISIFSFWESIQYCQTKYCDTHVYRYFLTTLNDRVEFCEFLNERSKG